MPACSSRDGAPARQRRREELAIHDPAQCLDKRVTAETQSPKIVGIEIDEIGRDEPVDAGQNPHKEYVGEIERQQVQGAVQNLPIMYEKERNRYRDEQYIDDTES